MSLTRECCAGKLSGKSPSTPPHLPSNWTSCCKICPSKLPLRIFRRKHTQGFFFFFRQSLNILERTVCYTGCTLPSCGWRMFCIITDYLKVPNDQNSRSAVWIDLSWSLFSLSTLLLVAKSCMTPTPPNCPFLLQQQLLVLIFVIVFLFFLPPLWHLTCLFSLFQYSFFLSLFCQPVHLSIPTSPLQPGYIRDLVSSNLHWVRSPLR